MDIVSMLKAHHSLGSSKPGRAGHSAHLGRGQVQELRQAGDRDARVVGGDDEDVVLDHAQAQVVPALLPGLAPEDAGLRVQLALVLLLKGGPPGHLRASVHILLTSQRDVGLQYLRRILIALSIAAWVCLYACEDA